MSALCGVIIILSTQAYTLYKEERQKRIIEPYTSFFTRWVEITDINIETQEVFLKMLNRDYIGQTHFRTVIDPRISVERQDAHLEDGVITSFLPHEKLGLDALRVSQKAFVGVFIDDDGILRLRMVVFSDANTI